MVKKVHGNKVRRAKVTHEDGEQTYLVTPSVARRSTVPGWPDPEDVWELSIDRLGLYVKDPETPEASWTLYPWSRVFWVEVEK